MNLLLFFGLFLCRHLRNLSLHLWISRLNSATSGTFLWPSLLFWLHCHTIFSAMLQCAQVSVLLPAVAKCWGEMEKKIFTMNSASRYIESAECLPQECLPRQWNTDSKLFSRLPQSTRLKWASDSETGLAIRQLCFWLIKNVHTLEARAKYFCASPRCRNHFHSTSSWVSFLVKASSLCCVMSPWPSASASASSSTLMSACSLLSHSCMYFCSLCCSSVHSQHLELQLDGPHTHLHLHTGT